MGRQKKVKIWWIYNSENVGYWTDNPDWIWEFKEMSDEDLFTIKCKELTLREYNKLVKNSGEFDGW